LKKILFASVVILIAAVAAAACGDNSIDTTVTEATFPVEVTDARVSAGENVYNQYCASCHGPVDGRPILESAPPHGDSGHTWHHPDRLLYQWILDKPPLGTVMPAFRGTLSDEEVLQVLAYIKSHWLPEIQQNQNEGSVQYEAQVREFGTE
jgi:mono/diheme cytochrome c family protein